MRCKNLVFGDTNFGRVDQWYDSSMCCCPFSFVIVQYGKSTERQNSLSFLICLRVLVKWFWFDKLYGQLEHLSNINRIVIYQNLYRLMINGCNFTCWCLGITLIIRCQTSFHVPLQRLHGIAGRRAVRSRPPARAWRAAPQAAVGAVLLTYPPKGSASPGRSSNTGSSTCAHLARL